MNHSLVSNLKTYLLAIVLAAASWWLAEVFRFEYKTYQAEVEAAKHSVDYFSTGYRRKDMNEQGVLKSELTAQSILHYSDDGVTHIKKPKLILYNPDKPAIPPWVVTADSGLLSGDGKNLLLNGKVTIDRSPAKGVRAVAIVTSNLHVQPKISYAESSEWTEIVTAPHRIEGVGLQLTFKRPLYVKLLSNVKSRYVPHS
jgi:lipopolysaccharide export system protein LptC